MYHLGVTTLVFISWITYLMHVEKISSTQCMYKCNSSSKLVSCVSDVDLHQLYGSYSQISLHAHEGGTILHILEKLLWYTGYNQNVCDCRLIYFKVFHFLPMIHS